MRVVIFWTMCHHSLGHEKKALLSIHINVSLCDTICGTISFYFVQLTMDDGSSETCHD